MDRRLSDDVAEKIRIRIETMPENSRLPSERELSQTYNVSRTIIREAIQKLEVMGILETRTGSGTYVRRMTPNDYIRKLLPMLSVRNNDIADIFEVRRLIEGKAAQLAALNRTEQDLKDMKSSLDQMKQSLNEEDMTIYTRSDLDFHYRIAKSSHNNTLLTIQTLISDLIFNSIVRSNPPSAMKLSMQFHNRIFEAISRQDEKAAFMLTDRHISGGEDYLKEKLLEEDLHR